MSPFFTIVIPNYKTEHFLEETLHSIKNQTFVDFECILVNDGSPGVPLDKIKKNTDSIYQNNIIPSGVEFKNQCEYIYHKFINGDNRFILLIKQNGGQGSARNMALDNAKGNFILFLDADDLYKPGHLQKIYKEVKKYKNDWQNTIFYFEDYKEFKIVKNKMVYFLGPATVQRSKKITLETNLVFNQTGSTFAAIHQSIFKNIRFRPLCKTMEDVEIINRMFLTFQKNNLKMKTKKININSTVLHRRHETSITTQDLANGSPREAVDMIAQYKDYLVNQPLTWRQQLLCRLGIIRFSLNPQRSLIHKYTRKIFTLIAKIISRWWVMPFLYSR